MDVNHPNAKPFALEAGENAILLIHGFTGTPGHLRTVGEAAARGGFSARGILLPGHGTSIEDMRKSSGGQWLDACREAYKEMRGRYRRVAVGGLSMGGLLSLLLAEELEPSCAVLFAPALRYRKAVNHFSPLVKHFMPVFDWGEEKVSEPEFLYEYHHGYTGAPVDRVEDMTRLQKAARQGLSKIACPLLVFQSHKDESVHRDVPERIMRGVSSTVKEICWIDRSRHVCTIGPDRDYVNSRTVDFLRRYGV